MEDSSYRLSYAKTLATQCLSQSTAVAYDKIASYQSRLTVNINECETIYDVNDILKSLSSRSGSCSINSDDALMLFLENEEEEARQSLPNTDEVSLLPLENRMDCTDFLLEGLNNDFSLGLPILAQTCDNIVNVITPLSRAATPASCVNVIMPNSQIVSPVSSIQSRLMFSVVDDNNNNNTVNKERKRKPKEVQVKEKKSKKPVGRPLKVVSEFEI